MTTADTRRRSSRLLCAFLLLAAICACGGRSEDPSPAEPAVAEETAGPAEVAIPSGPGTLPDALMPLTEGGVVDPVTAGSSTLMAHFEATEFATVRTRVTDWMPAHDWTLVPGSETDGEATAQTLEDLGMTEAAALARQSPSFGASYRRGGQTVAANIDSMDGTLRLSLTWF